jgi:preprotein translocase subunit SecA
MNQIMKYIIALTNLYGQVSASKIAEIYNSQNEDQISIDDVEVYFDEDLSEYYVFFHKNHFVHETIMEFNDFKSMLRKKADKPYYVPNKEELLKYSDMSYYERPNQYYDLMKYIKKNFFAGDNEKAELLCENMMWKCRDDFRPQEAFELFNTFEVNFRDENQVNEVLQLVMNLSNNVRLWENNGHTPQQIFEKFEKSNLKPLSDKPFQFGGRVKKEKAGRNDLCPCGSGKKYKKCCLNKEI